jgi:hypothetical protein
MQNPVDIPIISDFHLVDVLNEEGNDGSNSNDNSRSINTNDTQLLKTMLGISDADSITVSPNPETDIEPILEEPIIENNDKAETDDEIHSITSNEDDGIIEEGYIEAPDQNIRRSKRIQDHRSRKLLSYASAMLRAGLSRQHRCAIGVQMPFPMCFFCGIFEKVYYPVCLGTFFVK